MTTTTTSTPLHNYLCRIAGGYVPKAEVAEVTRLATETLKAERDAYREVLVLIANASPTVGVSYLRVLAKDALLARLDGRTA